jgi:hypothetical protein
MAIEELHDDVVAVARFRHVRVVEESVEEPVPYVRLGIHAMLDELVVRVDCPTQLETACVAVMTSVGGNLPRASGELMGATSGSCGSVPAR